MPSRQQKLQVLGAFTVLILFAAAVGCNGFFVDPQLTSISVTPSTVSLTLSQTRALVATGQYDDNSTKDLTSSVDWSSSATDVAKVSKSGVVTAASSLANPPGTAVITAQSGSFTATSTVTVNTGALQSIALTASNTSPTAGSTFTLTAKGTYSGSSTPQDITTQVTWNNDNTTAVTVNQGSGSATANSGQSGQVAHIFATLDGIDSNTLTINVQ
jgi:Bacterial Ig-like domain (group 2)